MDIEVNKKKFKQTLIKVFDLFNFQTNLILQRNL